METVQDETPSKMILADRRLWLTMEVTRGPSRPHVRGLSTFSGE